MKIQVYRGIDETVQLPLNASNYKKVMLGEHSLVFSFSAPLKLDVQVGDTLTYKGELMTINKAPVWTRSHVYQYEISFEGQRHSLERWLLMDEGALTFDYFGAVEEYMFMFLERLNAVDSGWSAEFDEGLDPVSVSFDEIDCYSALNDIAEAFGCEWDIVGKKITIKKTIGRATTLEFAYGKGNGLYELTRKRIDNSKIITRAYATGGSQNLPLGYAKRKLTLDGYLEDAAAIDAYGLREGVVSDEDVFPSRTGQATSVAKINEGTFSLTDTTIDFDIEGQRIDGTEAMIAFKSGALSGQQFKIISYNHSTKTIRYETNKDSNGGLMPSGNVIAEIGDHYTLVGIRMPQTYVTAALAKLADKREEYLESNKAPRVLYGLNIDILNLKRLGVEPLAGDIIRVTDADNAIDEEIRVTSVSYPGHFPDVLEQGMQFTAEIGNEVTYSRIQKVEKDIKDTKQVVVQNSRRSDENERISAMRMRQLQESIFDPDGYFDGSNIKPNSIETLMLAVGAKSQNFYLNGVRFEANSGDDPNVLTVSAGQLVHREIQITGLGYIWDIGSSAFNDLDPAKHYYLSAKCSRTALTGAWYLSEAPMMAESETGFIHFNIGILYIVHEGRRDTAFTYGMTFINGDNITTGKVKAERIDVDELFAQLITVGSGGYINAGISGLADAGNLSQRFWAGATEANRYNAPFSVLNDGSMRALKGKIGGFDITESSLKIGSNPEGSSWDVNSQTVFMTRDYFLMRDNGGIAGQRRELAWNLYRDQLGLPRASAASIFNTMATATGNPLFPYTNVGLELDVSGGDKNIALDIKTGTIRVGGDDTVGGVIPFVAGWTGTTAYWRNFTIKNGLIVGISDPYYA